MKNLTGIKTVTRDRCFTAGFETFLPLMPALRFEISHPVCSGEKEYRILVRPSKAAFARDHGQREWIGWAKTRKQAERILRAKLREIR